MQKYYHGLSHLSSSPLPLFQGSKSSKIMKINKFQLKTCHYNELKISLLSTIIKHKNKNASAIIRKLRVERIPMVSERPAIFQLENVKSVENCFNILNEHQPWHSGYVGFDTETTIFRKSDPQKVSMIQIATHDFCLLIQIYRIIRSGNACPQSLVNFLKDDKVLKVGVNASGDNDWLVRSYGIECAGIFDLDVLSKKKGYVACSLLKLAEMFSNLKLDKSKNKLWRYNFDEARLNSNLIKYVADDAFSSIQIYENLLVDKLNWTFLNYEKDHPMTAKEEDAELYALLTRDLIRGRGYKKEFILTALGTFPRWVYTKPKKEDLAKASCETFQKFLDEGLLIPTTCKTASANDNGDGTNTKITTSAENTTYKPLVLKKYKIPGIDPKIIFSSSFIDGYLVKKSLTDDEIKFLKAMWASSIKQINRDKLTQTYFNYVQQLNQEISSTVIYAIINSLKGKGIFSVGNKSDKIKINPLWSKELEDSYKQDIATGS